MVRSIQVYTRFGLMVTNAFSEQKYVVVEYIPKSWPELIDVWEFFCDYFHYR